jgi:hypothetical protein
LRKIIDRTGEKPLEFTDGTRCDCKVYENDALPGKHFTVLVIDRLDNEGVAPASLRTQVMSEVLTALRARYNDEVSHRQVTYIEYYPHGHFSGREPEAYRVPFQSIDRGGLSGTARPQHRAGIADEVKRDWLTSTLGIPSADLEPWRGIEYEHER